MQNIIPYLIAFSLIASDLALPLRPPATQLTGIAGELLLEAVIRAETRSGEELHVLELGAGRGEFLWKIRDLFRRIGFKPFVIGIDNGLIVTRGTDEKAMEDRRQWVYAMNELLQDQHGPGQHLMFMDVLDAPKHLRKFDFVFINAPWPANAAYDFMDAALELVRDSGFIFFRWHQADDYPKITAELIRRVKDLGYNVLDLFGADLPEGSYPMDEMILVIKKTSFANSDAVLRLAFTRLLDEIKARNEARKAA